MLQLRTTARFCVCWMLGTIHVLAPGLHIIFPHSHADGTASSCHDTGVCPGHTGERPGGTCPEAGHASGHFASATSHGEGTAAEGNCPICWVFRQPQRPAAGELAALGGEPLPEACCGFSEAVHACFSRAFDVRGPPQG